MVVRYDWQTADQEGFKGHPQRVLTDLGCKVTKYEAVGIADCSFMEIDKLPEPMPKFLQLSKHRIIEDKD